MTETTRDAEGLVEQLRVDADLLSTHDASHTMQEAIASDCLEAAAEIRRLRSELERRDAALREIGYQASENRHASTKAMKRALDDIIAECDRALATGGDDTKPFDHSGLTRPHWEPGLGQCQCADCRLLMRRATTEPEEARDANQR